MGNNAQSRGPELRRGEIWWADLGAYRPREQTGRRPVVIWQSDTLTRALQSVLVAFRADAPVIAALHPVNAVAIFTASLWIARSSAAWQQQRVPEGASSASKPGSEAASSEAS